MALVFAGFGIYNVNTLIRAIDLFLKSQLSSSPSIKMASGTLGRLCERLEGLNMKFLLEQTFLYDKDNEV